MSFIPLRIQSAYSFRESLIRLPDLFRYAAALGHETLALTDRDSLFGGVTLFDLGAETGIRPILGSLLTLADGSSLTLLIADADGYANLSALISHRHLESPPDWERVAAHAGGLIALCGGTEGAVWRALDLDDRPAAEAAARRLKATFGDRAYLEAPHPEAELAAIARRVGLPVVACAPTRYLRRQDADLWLTAQRGWQRYPEEAPDYHLGLHAEWRDRFRDCPDALGLTYEVAARCTFRLPLGQVHLPCFPNTRNPVAKLRALCEAALIRRYGDAHAEARARLEHELTTITEMGFADYFLIQWDVARHARERGIPVGPGRGSGAGSLVAYLLRLSDVCPLKHALAFERFLNPGRRELPDLDLDLCWMRRDEAIAHVFDRYGAERVSRLATINTMGARAALRLAGGGLGMEDELVDRVAKAFGHRPIGMELQVSPAAQAFPWSREPYATWLATAYALEGLPDHVGMHPCGVVVTPGPLTHLVPLMRSADGTAIAQADKHTAERLGLLKMDLLGNRNLTILHDAAAAIAADTGAALDPETLPLDDPEAFALLRAGETLGLYQLESTGVQSMLRQFQPVDLEDMTAITSLYRPGPIEGGIRERYIERRHGREPVTYAHPCLEPILGHTYGTVLFQEQCMQLAVSFAGLSFGEADMLRRAIAKQKPREMEALRDRFLTGARALGRTEAAIAEVFTMIIRFGGYGFVKAHAAASQVVAIRQAYLKARWPVHYLAAVLDTGMGYYPPRVYLEDARRFGATLAGPCLNRSAVGYTVQSGPEGPVLRFGLEVVSEVGQGARAIVAEREAGGPFRSLADFLERVPLGRDAIANLIKAGAADGFGPTRSGLLWALGQHRTPRTPRPTAAPLLPGLFAAETAPAWPIATEDAATRRAYEQALIGIALTPLTGVLWPTLPGATPLPALQALEPGTTVTVWAEIVYSRRVRTRDGKGFVMFLILSDGLHHQAATLFHKTYTRVWRRLAWNEPRLITGQIEVIDGELHLMVQDVKEVKGGGAESHRRDGRAPA